MAETIDLEQQKAADRRLALLALAAEQPQPAGGCLEAEELACLVEGRVPPERLEAYWAHLAGCEQCYAAWRQLDQEWRQQQIENTGRGRLFRLLRRPRLLAATGSILAIAASIAVFLNITQHTDHDSRLRFPARPAQEQSAAPPSESVNRRSQALEQGAPAQPSMARQGEQKASNRTEPVPQKKLEAAAVPAKARDKDADRAVAASQAPPPAAPPAVSDKAAKSAQPLAENSGEGSGVSTKESAPAPAQPPQALQAAAAQLDKAAAPGPLTLAEWQRMIREGCQGQPGPGFFAGVTAEGKRLLAMHGQTVPLSPEDRQRVTRILSWLAKQPHQQDAGRQCQALLELLGPVASDAK